MQVKKFEAPTMQEALKVIKRELGPDAIILSTKQNRSGFGLMSKASVEVTAAIAEKDLQKKTMAEKGLPQEVKEKIWNSKAEKQSEIYDNYFERQLKRAGKDKVEISAAKQRGSFGSEARERREQKEQQQAQQQAKQQAQQQAQQEAQKQNAVKQSQERRYVDIQDDDRAPAQAKAQPRATAQPRQNTQSPEQVKSLERDIENLKNMIQELTLSQATGVSSKDDQENNSGVTAELSQVMQDIIAAGIDKRSARQIIRQAAFDLSSVDQHDEATILDRVAYHLMQDVQVKDLLEGAGAQSGNSKTTVIALVGPTGVGKTTTIAKIASLGILEKRLRVGLINLDSYKVAAADQLATYARIMSIPFRSVTSKEELQQAIYDFSSLDLVLIDTTGRSQKDQESLLQLRHVLAGVENCQNALMVSATTKDSDMNDVVSRFKIFNPVGIVFSKLDETSVYGCIYNTQKRTGLPLLYFTVGQRVPEDIERASGERVVDLILDL